MSGDTDHRSKFVQEFDQWAHLTNVYRAEEFVLRTFLEKDKRTLEAGCGGGRLLLILKSWGFTDLHGYDFLPAFIEVARSRDESGTIDYRVMDATQLDYSDNSFDQLLLMQQILCFLPSVADQQRAVREAFRVLRPGGIVVVCVLAERARRQLLLHKIMLGYFSLLRTLTRHRLSTQFLPWMRTNKKKINLKALLDRGPYLYWFRESEVIDLFESAGFEVVSLGTNAQAAEGRFVAKVDELKNAQFRGGLYLVCKKPSS